MPRADGACPVQPHRLVCMESLILWKSPSIPAPWCRDCREAKRFLDQHKLAYTEINIETTPGAADEVVKRTGKRAIPQFVIDGEWVQPYRSWRRLPLRRHGQTVGG